jgi:hypothetical protein
LEREVVVADHFEQFKKGKELRIAFSITQRSEVCVNNSVSNVEQVHDTVGYPSIGASDDGAYTVGGRYTPTNAHDYPSNYFPPSAEVDPSSEIAVEISSWIYCPCHNYIGHGDSGHHEGYARINCICQDCGGYADSGYHEDVISC